MNRMIIVLDKVCLLSVIGLSFYMGYKTGVKKAELTSAFSNIVNMNDIMKQREEEK